MSDEQISATPWTTKGPRMVDMAADYAILDATGEIIGEAFGRSAVSRFHPGEANAKLFAAAPELLALVKRAVDVLQRHAPPNELSDHDALTELYTIFDGPEYRAAIEKARGPR